MCARIAEENRERRKRRIRSSHVCDVFGAAMSMEACNTRQERDQMCIQFRCFAINAAIAPQLLLLLLSPSMWMSLSSCCCFARTYVCRIHVAAASALLSAALALGSHLLTIRNNQPKHCNNTRARLLVATVSLANRSAK